MKEQVLTLVNKRIIGLYCHFDETGMCSTLNSSKKSLEMEHKALNSETALLQSRLKTEGSDLCDKVGKEKKLGAQVKEPVLQLAEEAEQLVVSKLKRDIYLKNQEVMSGK